MVDKEEGGGTAEGQILYKSILNIIIVLYMVSMCGHGSVDM